MARGTISKPRRKHKHKPITETIFNDLQGKYVRKAPIKETRSDTKIIPSQQLKRPKKRKYSEETHSPSMDSKKVKWSDKDCKQETAMNVTKSFSKKLPEQHSPTAPNRPNSDKTDKRQVNSKETVMGTTVKVQTHKGHDRTTESLSSNWKKFLESSEFKKLKQEEDRRKQSRKLQNHEKTFKTKGKKFAPNTKAGTGLSSANIKESRQNKSAMSKAPSSQRPEIWFDDVDTDLIENYESPPKTKSHPREAQVDKQEEEAHNPLVKETTFDGLTKIVAMDCEMVGVGKRGEDSVLARVSLVNQFGKCVYDKYVKPLEQVTDYRTEFSGIRPAHLKNAEEFSIVQKDVYNIIKGRLLVGHAIRNDLQVLFLDHPRKMIRDTSQYRAFRKVTQGKTPSLKKLTQELLGVSVQEGEHNSVEDAQAAVKLYMMHKAQWEKELKIRRKTKKFVSRKKITEAESMKSI